MSREDDGEDTGRLARDDRDDEDEDAREEGARETRETSDGFEISNSESDDAMDDDDDAMDDDDDSDDDDGDNSDLDSVSGGVARVSDDDDGRRPRRAAARAAAKTLRDVDDDDDDEFAMSDDERADDEDEVDEDEEEYRDVVEKILYCRETTPNALEFCVKWEGVSHRRCSWETEETLAREAPHKLKAFLKKHREVEAQDVPYPEMYDVIDRIVATREGESEGSREYLVKWRGLGYAAATWEASESLLGNEEDKAQIERFRAFANPEAFERTEAPRGKPVPPTFKNNMALREYQVASFEWMISNYCRDRNVILGDEMGLGKTAQCISVMEYVRKNLIRRRQPMCVVAPLTTLGHWKREIEKWTDMNAVVFDGSAADREVCAEYEFYVGNTREVKFDVLLVSFENVRRNVEIFEQFSWAMCVVDEAHKMKDVNSQTTASVMSLRYDWLLLLTGTPIQNNIKELYGMLHILDPRQFHSWDDFKEEFCDASGDVDAEQVMRLRDILKPRMLRRMKEDVEKIPTKEEIVVWVELTPQQRAYYRALYENQIHVLLEGSKVKNVPQLRNLSMELRKVCNHPFLCDGLEEDYVAKRLAACAEKGEEAPSAQRMLVEGSGKMSLLAKLLAKLKRDGHKVLIFSQFTIVLDLIQDFLAGAGYETERLDGNTSAENRQAGIDRFNTPGRGFAYLLSTRAGGMGITLTSADTAIIFDSDWNPQNDLQAMARCHRIGQTKEVKVYRFVTKDTYEQSLFETASRKYGLDEAILGGGGEDDEDDGRRSKKTAKEQAQRINELLKFGVHGALRDASGEEADAFAAEDIDEILSRRAEHREVGPRAGNSFSVATFGADVGDDGVDDETFWERAFGGEAIQAAKEKAAEQIIDKRFAVEGPRKRRKVNYRESNALVAARDDSGTNRGAASTRDTYNARRAEAKRLREEEKKLKQEEREARRRERAEELERQREEAKLNWFTWEVEHVVDAVVAFGAPDGDVTRAVTYGTLDVDKPFEQKIAVAETILKMFAVIQTTTDALRRGDDKDKDKDDDDDKEEEDQEDTEETKTAVFEALEHLEGVPEKASTALTGRVFWGKLLRAMPRRTKLMKQRAALAKLIVEQRPEVLDADDADAARRAPPKEKDAFDVPALGGKGAPPAEWWTVADDEDLLRGSLRYGYTPSFSRELERQFDCIRNDRTLRFASRTGVYDDGEYRRVLPWPTAAALKTRLARLLKALSRPPKKPSKAEILAAQRKAAAEARLKRDMEALRAWQRKQAAAGGGSRSGTTPTGTRSPLKRVFDNPNVAKPLPATKQQSIREFFGGHRDRES